MTRRGANIIGTVLSVVGLVLIPYAARAEHCAGALYVDDLEPSVAQSWPLDSIQVISWLIGDGCGPLTYRIELSRNGGEYELLGETGPHQFYGRVEYPWLVHGLVGDVLVFRVRRVLVDRDPPYAYSEPIQIQGTVSTQKSSWSALRARY